MKYRTIVADPPWQFKDSGGRTPSPHWPSHMNGVASRVPYAQLPVEDIAALPVRDMAEADAHLYVWTINAYLPQAYEIVAAWGFKPSTLLTWCKAPRGMGFGGAYVNTTEFVLFARRGSLAHKERVDSTWFPWKRPYAKSGASSGAVHSAKPDGFLDTVERVSPGPYLEMFARRARFGWDYWGNESLGTAEVAA